jgi:hypothetical protein
VAQGQTEFSAVWAYIPKERLREWMDQALTRADDRALFGLLPVPSEAGTRTGPSVETAGAPRAG